MPRNVNRAITCVVESRRDLRKAAEALEVAIAIFEDLDDADAAPLAADRRVRSLAAELAGVRRELVDIDTDLERIWDSRGWLR